MASMILWTPFTDMRFQEEKTVAIMVQAIEVERGQKQIPIDRNQYYH